MTSDISIVWLGTIASLLAGRYLLRNMLTDISGDSFAIDELGGHVAKSP